MPHMVTKDSFFRESGFRPDQVFVVGQKRRAK